MQISSSTDTERNLAVELVLEDIPGGGVVEKDDFPTTDTEMQEGALLGVASDGIYHLTKTALLAAAAGSGATTYYVPNSPFIVGDFIVDRAGAGTSRAITAIAASGSTAQVITVGTTINAAASLASGTLLIQASATGASGTAVAFKYTPVAIATNPVDLTADNTGCGLLVRGRVRESLLPYPVDSTIKALLPLIRFV